MRPHPEEPSLQLPSKASLDLSVTGRSLAHWSLAVASGGLEDFILCCPFHAALLGTLGVQSSQGQEKIPAPLTCGGLRVPPF